LLFKVLRGSIASLGNNSIINNARGKMFRLKISTSFASAHNLINYQGECENLHGHNWKVEVSVTAKALDKAGLGIDFKILKAETNKLLKTLDHKYLNELPPFSELSPSSENIAQYLFHELGKSLDNENVKVEMVTVWESDFAGASYFE
jgi:6-pyruvoyltetrahydropterin/6-carboxytetrahydropterin synthase